MGLHKWRRAEPRVVEALGERLGVFLVEAPGVVRPRPGGDADGRLWRHFGPRDGMLAAG